MDFRILRYNWNHNQYTVDTEHYAGLDLDTVTIIYSSFLDCDCRLCWNIHFSKIISVLHYNEWTTNNRQYYKSYITYNRLIPKKSRLAVLAPNYSIDSIFSSTWEPSLNSSLHFYTCVIVKQERFAGPASLWWKPAIEEQIGRCGRLICLYLQVWKLEQFTITVNSRLVKHNDCW